MKLCKCKGCNNGVFSMEFCRIHQWMRTDEKYKRYKDNKKQGKIPKRTEKRAKDERHYAVLAKEFYNNAVINKTNQCFMCGENVLTFQGTHHIEGRREGALLDFDKIVLVHNECHLMVHDCSVEILEKQTWYNDFLIRLKDRFPQAYNKQIGKKDKANPINPQRGLFDDED